MRRTGRVRSGPLSRRNRSSLRHSMRSESDPKRTRVSWTIKVTLVQLATLYCLGATGADGVWTTWPEPVDPPAVAGTARRPKPRESPMTHKNRLMALLSVLSMLVFAAQRAEAAPQALGLTASNGVPTPLRCAAGL